MTRVPGPLRAILATILVSALIALVVVRARDDALPEDASNGAELSSSNDAAPPEVAQAVDAIAAPSPADSTPRAEASASEGAAPVEIVVLTRDKLMENSKPIPRIRVVVGLGVPPLGAAHGKGSRAGRPLDATQSELHEVVTDDQGRASISIPRSAVDAALQQPGGAVWARTVEPGYQQRTYVKRPQESAAAAKLQFIHAVFPGLTVRGRVLDGSGAPVAARVSLKAFDFEGKLGIGSLGHSGEDGWFEIFPFRAGIQHLLADADDAGTGALRDLDLDAPLPDPFEVSVQGPGVLRGRVLDGGGAPVPGLDLGVWMSALDDEQGSFVLAEPAHSFAQLEGRGRTWITLKTDAMGAFVALGLRRDLYVIRAGNSGSGPFPIQLTPQPVAADGDPLELRLERTVLAVRIVDERGEPWKGAVGMGERARWSRAEPRAAVTDRWPAETTLVVLPVREDMDAGRYESPRRAGAADSEGVFVVPVAAGKRYRVGLLGGFQPWKPAEVEVSTVGGRVGVVVSATSVDACGALALRVLDKNGTLLSDDYSIRIEDTQDGATLLFDDLGKDHSSPQGFRLPEGTYRVVVQGEPSIDHHHGTLMSPSSYGRFETIVDIRRDATTKLDATLPAGARIRLSLAGEVLDEDRDAVRAAHSPNAVFGSPIDYWAGRAATALVAADRWPIPVSFTYEITSTSAAGTHLGDWLTLGTEGTSELLPAGRYRFEARLPGGRFASADVTLVDGETTTVALTIPPRAAPTPK